MAMANHMSYDTTAADSPVNQYLAVDDSARVIRST
jgi:hypothetical protein